MCRYVINFGGNPPNSSRQSMAMGFLNPLSYALQGLPCDGDWDDFQTNARQYKSDMWNQAADALTEAVQPSLAVVDANSPDNAYLCEDGIKWYTVNSFKGCTLKDGKTFDYRGKTYKNDENGNEGVMSVAMTVSYVCNKQARVRDMGFSYTTVTKTDCRP